MQNRYVRPDSLQIRTPLTLHKLGYYISFVSNVRALHTLLLMPCTYFHPIYLHATNSAPSHYLLFQTISGAFHFHNPVKHCTYTSRSFHCL